MVNPRGRLPGKRDVRDVSSSGAAVDVSAAGQRRQTFQPGMSQLTDRRRVPDRRSGYDRRMGLARELGLTPRQLEIVANVVAGFTNKEIAQQLSLSEDTVKHHLTNIFDRKAEGKRGWDVLNSPGRFGSRNGRFPRCS